VIPSRLVLATGNAGKVAELRALVREWGEVQVESLADYGSPPLPPEDGDSYEANARLKALAVAAATGRPALADDSGLEVDALGGAPGLHSARYAPTDPERIARLLSALAAVADGKRTARFRCVVALASPDGIVLTAEGICPGRILHAPDGAGGFGYDPVFWSEGLGTSFGRASAEAKHRVSHRAGAVRALGARLRVGAAGPADGK
jgi:XTP/dITP diphosphohydrolase